MAKEVEQWITVNGVHIPLFKGDSKEAVVKSFLNKSKQSATGKEKLKNTMSLRNEIKEIFQKNGNVYGYDVNALHDKGYSGTDIQNQINYFRLSPSQAKFREKYFKKQSDDQKNISKNEDEKEAQITRNQKEAEARKAEENRPVKELHEAKIKELESDKYEGDNTYDLDTLKPVSFKDGYQVTFCQIGDNYTNDQYQTKVNECLKLSSNGKTYAGKFEGTPEISFHCANREQAIAYAKANNQISIWDWKAMQDAINHPDQPELWAFCEIKTGGTGRRK